MDVDIADRTIHLPLELVERICSYLSSASDIQAARLVSRCFSNVATKLITDTWSSPSLLFARAPKCHSQAYHEKCSETSSRSRWVATPVTLWTTLKIPIDVQLEDPHHDLGRQFEKLVFAPDKPIYGRWSHRSFHAYGRKAVSWGRMIEHPELFCLVMRECRD